MDIASHHHDKKHSKSRTNSHTNANQITESSVVVPRRKKLFGFLSLVDLGCGRFSKSTVSVTMPENSRRRRKKKKKKKMKQRRNRGSCPENVCCTPPVVGFAYDVAQSTSSDTNRRNHRQVSFVFRVYGFVRAC